MKNLNKYRILIAMTVALVGVFLYPLFAYGSESKEEVFYVNPEYEVDDQEKEEAVHITSSTRAHFFVEKEYYENLSKDDQDSLVTNIANTGVEFDSSIYLKLKNVFGSEWSPGIDEDSRITIYITSMQGNIDGYFREVDEFPRSRNWTSNEREMVYINIKFVGSGKLSAIIAHEFQHLINFNQKNRLNAIEEEEWLNEALSEYAVTVTDVSGAEGRLAKSVKDFIANPTNSLGIWEAALIDRGSVSLFIHYLADVYGEKLIGDISRSKFIGSEAIEDALKKNGSDKSFSDIFSDWTVALFINSSIEALSNENDLKEDIYKFTNPNLGYRDLHIAPQLTYIVGSSQDKLDFVVRDLAPQWHRFLPSSYDFQNPESLDIIFKSDVRSYFKIPVIVTYLSGQIDVLNTEIIAGVGSITVPKFNTAISSVVVIPASHTKDSGLVLVDPLRTFSYKVSLAPDLTTIIVPDSILIRDQVQEGLQNGDVIRLDNRPEVYVVKDGYRRHLQGPEIFDFYGHLDWQNINSVSGDVLGSYKESGLIRRAGDTKVYEVTGIREVRWLDMIVEEFEESGRSWDQVYEVNDAELEWYENL